jgi:hypothetical protein
MHYVLQLRIRVIYGIDVTNSRLSRGLIHAVNSKSFPQTPTVPGFHSAQPSFALPQISQHLRSLAACRQLHQRLGASCNVSQQRWETQDSAVLLRHNLHTLKQGEKLSGPLRRGGTYILQTPTATQRPSVRRILASPRPLSHRRRPTYSPGSPRGATLPQLDYVDGVPRHQLQQHPWCCLSGIYFRSDVSIPDLVHDGLDTKRRSRLYGVTVLQTFM